MIARSRLLACLVLAVAAAVAVLVPEARSQTPPPSGQPGQPGESPISGRAVLTPRIVLFGDTVRARIDVVLDRSRVDPDTVRVAAAFSPWNIVAEPDRVRRDAGSTTYLRTTYVLRCLTGPCVPSGQVAPLEFDPVRVTYTGLADDAGQEIHDSIRVEWPLLTVYSRFASAGFEGLEASPTPWRADVLTLPAASHRASPGLVLALLVGLGGLLAAAGAALVYLAWPRRAPAPPPAEPEAPLPQLTPLEQALLLLEDAARADGAADRRRSLELVAEVLAEHGDADLARSARVLAWSEDEPAVEDTIGLAARVRSTLELEEAAEQEGNGRVV